MKKYSLLPRYILALTVIAALSPGCAILRTADVADDSANTAP